MGACSGASQKEMVEGQPADPQLPAGDPVRRAREPIVRKRQLVEELPIAQLPAKQPKAVPLLPASWRATDAVQEMGPTTKAKGESHAKSLSQPQSLARQLLPTAEFRTLEEYALAGARADCGPPWPAT